MLLDRLFTKLFPLAPRVANELKYIYLDCDATRCYYCNSPAKALDHVLPISLARLLPYYEFPSELLTLVPCCTRCNSVAGNRFFISLEAKRKFIVTRLNELRVRAQYAEVINRLEKLLGE